MSRVFHIAKNGTSSGSSKPTPPADIGAKAKDYDQETMMEEASAYIMKHVKRNNSERTLLSDPINDWGTVTRGNPQPHKIPLTELPAAGLTPATWYCNIKADPFIEPPYVRAGAVVENEVTFDLATLTSLGEKYGTIKVMKAMQCLNVDSPLGQGVWEGVPLRIVLKMCGEIQNCRRIYYWGYHNNDPKQVFRSSISYAEAFEHVPNEPPVILAYKLNGKPLPLVRGGPVRMIVPFGHGFKNVKFIQNIRLTNDYRANDTYAQIDEGDEGNDPGSIQKTYTTVDLMLGSPAIKGDKVTLSGVLMNGRTPCAYLEYWVRGPSPELQKAQLLEDNDPILLNGDWKKFDIPSPPVDFNDVLPNNIQAKDIFGIGNNGVPKVWPLPFSYTSWSVTIKGMQPGFYEIRARAVDIHGNKQPEPRPYRKNGRNGIGTRRVQIV